MTVTLSPPTTLQHGCAYRLSLRATGCTSQQNCYAIFVPYSSEQVPGWPALTWGGTAAYETFFNGTSWQQNSVPSALTFSLQTE